MSKYASVGTILAKGASRRGQCRAARPCRRSRHDTQTSSRTCCLARRLDSLGEQLAAARDEEIACINAKIAEPGPEPKT
jgi:hypothetical protein